MHSLGDSILLYTINPTLRELFYILRNGPITKRMRMYVTNPDHALPILMSNQYHASVHRRLLEPVHEVVRT